MRKIGFVVDSTFGYKGNEASIVPLKVYIDGKEYIDGTFENSLIVDAIKENKKITTSQPSPNLFFDAYKNEFDKGYEHVICLTISSSLSGTINSANIAKDLYEGENITIIDTKSANVGSEFILEEAIRLANEGKSLEEILNYTYDLIEKGSVIFSVDNFQALVKGGRIGKITALIGSVLKIKPILRFNSGVLSLESKVRGLLSVFKYIASEVAKFVDNDKVVVRITYVDNIEYAKNLEEEIKKTNTKNLDIKITDQLTAAVSAHIGLGGLGIYLVGL